jgi:hypothetical protein
MQIDLKSPEVSLLLAPFGKHPYREQSRHGAGVLTRQVESERWSHRQNVRRVRPYRDTQAARNLRGPDACGNRKSAFQALGLRMAVDVEKAA